jgi:hypothetical protein
MTEQFNFRRLDLSRENDQKKFDDEFSKLSELGKKSVVQDAMNSAEYENKDRKQDNARAKEWQEQIVAWKKDPQIKQEIDSLIEQIASNQEKITPEIMEKVQDIMQSHFAKHGASSSFKWVDILQDGIFSVYYGKKYNEKQLGKLRNVDSSFDIEKNGYNEQGSGRISTNSPEPMINTLERIMDDKELSDIYPVYLNVEESFNFLGRDFDYTQPIEQEKLQNLKDEVVKVIDAELKLDIPINIKTLTFDGGFNSRGEIVGLLEVDKKFWVDKEVLIKDTIVLLYEQLQRAKCWYRNDDFSNQVDYPMLTNFFDKFKEFKKQFPRRLDRRGGKEDENYQYYQYILGNIKNFNENNVFLSEIFKNFEKFKEEYLKLFYEKIGWRSDGGEILIDLDKIPNNLINKIITRSIKLKLDCSDGYKLETDYPENIYFDHKFETPITGRVKPNWFAGFVRHKEKPKSIDFKETILEITNIIKRINIENIKNLSSDEIQLVEKVKNGSEEINPKDVLMFASKICNYNFFNENINNQDFIKALANFGRLPVYSSDGDLIWPVEMKNEEVKKNTISDLAK